MSIENEVNNKFKKKINKLQLVIGRFFRKTFMVVEGRVSSEIKTEVFYLKKMIRVLFEKF